MGNDSAARPRTYYNDKDQEVPDNRSYAAIVKAVVEIVQSANFLGPVESNGGFTQNGEPISGGGGSAHTIQDEGTSLTARSVLNFVGSGVTATDAGGKTVVTIPGDAVTSVNTETGAVTLDSDDISDTGKTHKFATAAQLAKVDNISVTQAVDLDTLESDTVTNNAKTSNATHTGEVTGATALTVDKTAISGKTLVTAVGADAVLIGDASDSDNLKKALISDFANVTHTGEVTGATALTIANNAVVTAKIADSNVTTAKIADANVTTVKILDSNVTTAKIADSNVTTAKIADSNVTTAKILDANVTNAKLANMATKTVKARNTGSTGVPEDVTIPQMQQWRYTSEASNATPSINCDNVGRHSITALAAAITALTVTGTPFDGQLLWISVLDNGTARAINFGSTVENSTQTMPTTTVISTPLDMLFRWNSVTSKWRLISKA